MRIIAGKYRGRKVYAPATLSTKPTTDRIRENLFNILRPHLDGASFLDLFSCSGALGIEALSRGAAFSVFCDKSREAIKSIQNNLISLKVPQNDYRIIHADYISALRLLKGGKFNIIFLDPPFNEGLYDRALRLIVDLGLLAEGGVIVLEHHERTMPECPPELAVSDARHYGTVVLSFLTQL